MSYFSLHSDQIPSKKQLRRRIYFGSQCEKTKVLGGGEGMADETAESTRLCVNIVADQQVEKQDASTSLSLLIQSCTQPLG